MISTETLIDNGRSRLWIAENFSPDFFDQIKSIPLLVEPPIVVFGVQRNQNRNVAFFSDHSTGYKYSGQIMESSPLSDYPLLQHILQHTNNVLGTKFNGILINSYINGEKSIGAHSDDESSLDKTNKMVASIAYGAIRKFRIRDKSTKKIVLDYQHTPGTLLIMDGEFQSDFTHEIPKELKVHDERISLTFRYHID